MLSRMAAHCTKLPLECHLVGILNRQLLADSTLTGLIPDCCHRVRKGSFNVSNAAGILYSCPRQIADYLFAFARPFGCIHAEIRYF